MRKHFFPLLLVLLLLPPAVSSAHYDNTGHITRCHTYTGQFSDLSPHHIFYSNVTALYEYGLSNGKTDGTFGLQDNVTVGQSIIFAARLRSLYFYGDPEQGARPYVGMEAGQPYRTELPYLKYLKAEGVLRSELDSALSACATRAQVAHILANVLPQDALPRIHDALITQCYASRKYITDVSEYTPYQQDILTLYRCGILSGNDASGSFFPDSPITRGALAAMLTRMIDPNLRITLNWLQPGYSSAVGTTLADLIVPGAYIPTPETDDEIDQDIRYMLSRGENSLTLHYPSTPSIVSVRNTMTRLLACMKQYCEQSFNAIRCTFSPGGSVTFVFSAMDLGVKTEDYRQGAMTSAIQVHDALWESGFLTPQMSQAEIARVYYDWICVNCTYDINADDDSLSHLPYSLFHDGVAVCDGYTAAYNLLLKLEGIACYALPNSDHIWTVAVLDGREVHIDTTWGDLGNFSDGHFFAMSPQQSYKAHPW